MSFAVGDKVWLWTRNLETSRRLKRLDFNHTGPYPVTKIVNKNAYNLDLPSTMRNHNIFHVSLLDRYTPPVRGQPSSEPHTMIVKETQEYKVDCVPDSRWRYRKLHHLIPWAGYNHIRTSWERVERLETARDLVDKFHRERPDRPWA